MYCERCRKEVTYGTVCPDCTGRLVERSQQSNGPGLGGILVGLGAVALAVGGAAAVGATLKKNSKSRDNDSFRSRMNAIFDSSKDKEDYLLPEGSAADRRLIEAQQALNEQLMKAEMLSQGLRSIHNMQMDILRNMGKD